MNFDHSSQARSWLFDEDTLLECRNKVTRETSLSSVDASVKVKNFASGFSSRMDSSVRKRKIEGETILISDDDYNFSSNHNADSSHLTSSDQEILVRFHAHQICSLVGPDAVIPSLIRSQHVLATAIVMFRRFYLSNSVLDFKPRAMAVAAAFLASKVDDEKIKVERLEHASDLIQKTVMNDPLWSNELAIVTIDEIEKAERDLLHGLNYELRCHHPFDAIDILAAELENFFTRGEDPRFFFMNSREDPGDSTLNPSASPRHVFDIREYEVKEGMKWSARMIALNATIFSDVTFLHPPGQIAFAAISLCVPDIHKSMGLPLILRTYLRDRFISKTETALLSFEEQVSIIVEKLKESPMMDLKMLSMSCNLVRDDTVSQQADELRRVLLKFSSLISDHRNSNQFFGISPKKCKLSESILEGAYHKTTKVTPTKLFPTSSLTDTR